MLPWERTILNVLSKSPSTMQGRYAVFKRHTRRGKSVASAIETGYRNFDDLRALLEDARKFRAWLSTQPIDGDRLREYVEACGKLSWVDNLPNKTIRYLLFGSLGIALGSVVPGPYGAIAGLALNAVDSFLFERLVAGWKPNHFVGQSLVPFVADGSYASPKRERNVKPKLLSTTFLAICL